MKCSNCGTTNETGRKFCKECGTALAVVCPNCATANAPDAKFCGECATPLISASRAAPAETMAAATAPPPEAAAAERRLVSVLFADLVGFTTLAEERDPEGTRELLSGYFAIARDLIGRHGGTVEKFIGDAVMAVWGAPVAREDDAERAVRAALALVDAVPALGPGISARAGVLTGEAAVTVGATGQGMVAGDLVNTASRLQSVAAPGTVLVGESTQRAASQAIAFAPAGQQTLKGKTLPVRAFRALRIVAEVGGRNRADRLEAPFVGRDDEFRLLKDLFHATERDRRPRLVSVLGPAGIGKSRLAWEFLKYADGLIDTTYWHAGRSPSYGEGIAFWALGEMVRRRAGLLESDDPDTTREKVAASTGQWCTDESERRWVEAALLALLGLGEPLPGGRDEMFAAWRTFFERIAERGTTVLLFEDLQWADSGMLDFIDHLLDWTKALPIFVLTLARPELLQRRSAWGAGRRNFVSLALEPLTKSQMRALLEGLVPGLPDAAARHIVDRADGVPLYAMEMVRMLVTDGRLRQVDGVYRPVGKLDTIAIPETLSALIAARLDNLDPAERSLVQHAAVLGQSFTLEALAAVSGQEREEVKAGLANLTSRELLAIEVDPRSPERGQYTFVQGLIREVAYNQLARAERKSRHLAAARWLETLGDQELSGVLADHYAAAHRNARPGPEADALANQARVTLRAAAERAASLGSHLQALRYIESALELTDDEAERALLLERAGREATDGMPDIAERYFERALEACRTLGDELGQARAATGISIVLHYQSRPADAIPVLERVAADLRALESQPDYIRLLAELTRAYGNSGHPDALATADRVLTLAEPLNLMPIIAEALINRSLVLVYKGRHHESTALLRGVLPLTEAHDLVWPQLRALNNLASELQNDDLLAAKAVSERGIEVARRTGALGTMRYFQAGLANNQFEIGDWDAAIPLLFELEEVAGSERGGGWALDYLFTKTLLYAYRGQADLAAAAIDELHRVMATVSHVEYISAAACVEAQVSALAGRFAQARRHALGGMTPPTSSSARNAAWAARISLWLSDFEQARHAVETLENAGGAGRIVINMQRESRAGVEALGGDRRKALTGYADAVAAWRELEAVFPLALCLTDMAITLGVDGGQGHAAAEEARTIWTRLEATPMLALLDAAAGGGAKTATSGPAARTTDSLERSAAG